MKTRTAFLFGLLTIAGLPAPAAGAAAPVRERVVLLPLVNRSGAEGALADVVPVVAARIAAKGYDVVQGDDVEAFLEAERVRYVDSLTDTVRGKLLTRFEAAGVVSGSLYTFLDGANPIVGLSARLVRMDSRMAWSGVIGLSAAETEGLFALGRVSGAAPLAAEAVERLFGGFPAPGSSAPAALAGKPLFLSGPTTYRAATLPKDKVHRICILPLANLTASKEAPWAVAEILAEKLAASGRFDVVEPADFRAAAVAEKLRGFRDPDPDLLRKLAPRVGTSLFLRGTVYRFREGSPRGATMPPEIDVELSLVDVERGRIVWASSHARSGSDYRGFLQLGGLTSAVALTDRVVGEMVAAAEKASLKSPPLNGNGNGHGTAARVLKENQKGTSPP